MAVPSHLEIPHRWHLIRIETAFVHSPGVEGWIGSWSIYLAPVRPGDVPLRYGDTDVHKYEVVALGAAKTVATLVASSLE